MIDEIISFMTEGSNSVNEQELMISLLSDLISTNDNVLSVEVERETLDLIGRVTLRISCRPNTNVKNHLDDIANKYELLHQNKFSELSDKEDEEVEVVHIYYWKSISINN